MPQILGSSVSYRIAVGPQQGRKAFMIRTIRPLDRPDPGLERVAKANGFSLHAGVSCEGHQKDKRERLCRYIAPNHRWRGEVTPAKRGKALKMGANAEVKTPAECHAAMSWAQRLKRVFNIDVEVCGRCGGSVRVVACIEDEDIIDRILAHLRKKRQEAPARPLQVPPTRAPPETLPLFAGSESRITMLNQQGR